MSDHHEVGGDFERRSQLSALADQIQECGRDLYSGEYIDGSINPTRMTVTVYWHGIVPARVDDLISEARLRGVVVVIIAAPFSKAELKAASRVILKHAQELGIGLLLRLSDGSGFSVRFRTEEAREVAIAALSGRRQLPHIDVLRTQEGRPAVQIDNALSARDWA